MLSHDAIWSAIDRLAQDNGLSASGLAKAAGLDPTSFNRSKRISADGRPRWPSTESLSRILAASNTSIDAFLGLLQGNSPRTGSKTALAIPLIGLAQAGEGGFFGDNGLPQGEGWDAVEFPAPGTGEVYAIEVQGDSMLPLYRDGDVLIVDPAAQTRKGDRVVVKTRDGEVLAKLLKRRTATQIELLSINPAHPDRQLQLADVEWIARIVWASQ